MLSWILQISVISIIFIFLVHHLLCFFKSTLTVPKMKDLVNSPVKKYQDIFDTITNSNNTNYNTNYNKYLPNPDGMNDYTDINLLPSENTNTNTNTNNNASGMKDELKMFLKKQLNSSNELETLGQSSSFGSPF
jgi:hypothetical protein